MSSRTDGHYTPASETLNEIRDATMKLWKVLMRSSARRLGTSPSRTYGPTSRLLWNGFQWNSLNAFTVEATSVPSTAPH